jgi:hypothetical protein
MSEVVIHLYCRQSDGTIEDAQHTFDLSDFGGFLPAVGDKILDPGAPASLERHVWCRGIGPDPRGRETLAWRSHPGASARSGPIYW